jgi:hypothetical protein
VCLFAFALPFAPHASAQEIVISKITPSGQIEFNIADVPSNYVYTVEWAPHPNGPWHTTFDSLNDFTPTSGVVRIEVPHFYRIMAYPDGTFQRDQCLYYTFETLNDGILPDLGPEKHNGNVYGADLSPDGLIGNCYYFNGVDDYVDFGTDMIVAAPFSVSMWFRTVQDKRVHSLFGNYVHSSYTGNGFTITRYGTAYMGGRLDVHVGGDQLINVPFPYDETWHHVVVIFSRDNTASLYLDGVFKTEVPAVYMHPKDVSYRMGKALSQSAENTCLKGYIDNLHVYRRALRGDEIREMAEQECIER